MIYIHFDSEKFILMLRQSVQAILPRDLVDPIYICLFSVSKLKLVPNCGGGDEMAGVVGAGVEWKPCCVTIDDNVVLV